MEETRQEGGNWWDEKFFRARWQLHSRPKRKMALLVLDMIRQYEKYEGFSESRTAHRNRITHLCGGHV